jgi:carboxyl-terminal processing protease
VAIVVDGLSASTSEFFAGGMQSLGRARVFGETTAGQALPATLVTLPDGDVLLHAFADFRVAGGRRLEGVGVTPDEPVALRRADLLAGGDPAMDAAIRWAGSDGGGP